uniref:Uncharacterized protein n=1 Tax=Schistocephalus solidus TaxID=70667 RepID=A0A0V0J5P9_SCHSO
MLVNIQNICNHILLKLSWTKKKRLICFSIEKSTPKTFKRRFFSVGILSSGTSKTPLINDGTEEKTCGCRKQLDYFQGTSDTKECGINLERANAHDGSSKVNWQTRDKRTLTLLIFAD